MKPVTATYRLQFSCEFTFADAERVVPYLARLGVSHMYASPVFTSQPGSAHGYDVLDHHEIDPELGGRDAFDSLVACAHRHGLAMIQDIVPNHMAYSPANPLLRDLLENGERSRYRDFFDIDWDTPYQSMSGRLIAPFLGDLYGAVLDRGELSLEYDEVGFAIRYYEMRFPLRVETYLDVLSRRLPALEAKLGRDHPDTLKLLGVLYTLESLPEEADPGARADKVAFVKRMLWELYRGSGDVRTYLNQTIEEFNGTPGDPDSFTALNELHWKQVYRLAYWKVASEEINYRRFFSINDLICLRVEDLAVFEHAHRLLFELVDNGSIDGLRVDHIDGLYEPGAYLARLRHRVGTRPIYVEKILHPGEALPDHWPVDGTTGYDTLNVVNGLFIDTGSAKRVRGFYRSLTGIREEYQSALFDRKRNVLTSQMAGDLDNLARYLRRVVGDDRYGIDITFPSLKRALAEVMVHLPVYRTYVTDRINREADIRYVKDALARARRRLPHHTYEFDYIESFLLLSYDEHVGEETRRRWGDVVLRFQQFTGPLMAKGLEDTLMYAYVPLLSVNEVGGNPEVLGIDSGRFHDAMRALAASYPRSLTASSTHDTKRGEETRLRINTIAGHIDAWSRSVREWRSANRPLRRRVAGAVAPDANDEYLIYQTLVGVLPGDAAVDDEIRSRLRDYTLKALREAKRHTDWSSPNEPYEDATLGFLDGVLGKLGRVDGDDGFGTSFREFLERIEPDFSASVLAHQAVRLTAPGVPDLYRGTELPDFTLVDPDNRRPVDWTLRARMLDRVAPWVEGRLALLDAPEDTPSSAESTLDDAPVDLATRKLALVHLLVRLRARCRDIFLAGDYLPVAVVGGEPESLIAFARAHAGRSVLTVARRRAGSSDEPSASLRTPSEATATSYIDLISGSRLEAHDGMIDLGPTLQSWPVAVLWSVPPR